MSNHGTAPSFSASDVANPRRNRDEDVTWAECARDRNGRECGHKEDRMQSTSPMPVEEHLSAATMYATGDLTMSNLPHAIAYVEHLPEQICALCVDLTGVRRTDPEAL